MASMTERVYRGLSIILGLLLLLAATSKIVDARMVSDSISFALFARPPISLLPLALGTVVIAAEVAIGLHLVLWRPGPYVVGAATLLIGAFTLVLMRLATLPGAPDCGCFSLARLRDGEATRASGGLPRNIALLLATLWMLRHALRRGRSARRERLELVPTTRSRVRGFTIIELVLVIAIVAILFSLALPSLMGSRMRAEMTRSLSTHRQILGSVSLYTMDHDDTLPSFGTQTFDSQGDAGPGPIYHGDTRLGKDYFQTHLFYWSSLIYPAYFDNLHALEQDGRAHESYTQDVLGMKKEVRSVYTMTYTAWADAKLWNDGAPEPTRKLLRATRTGEIVFPSEKGLLLDVKHGAMNQEDFPGYRNLSVGRADGSAGELNWWSVPLSAVYSHADWPVPWKLPVLATRDGLSGRDFGIPTTD